MSCMPASCAVALGFHEESLEEAIAQLTAVAPLLIDTEVPAAALALDGTLERCLHGAVDIHGTTISGEGCVGQGRCPSHDKHCGQRPPGTEETDGEHVNADSAEVDTPADDSKERCLTSVPPLLPSVRCGLEMALVHLVSRSAGVGLAPALSAAAGLACEGAVRINGLATREELGHAVDAVSIERWKW